MAIEQTKISKEELKIFKKLKNIKMVFDVGARIDIDYLDLKPKAEFHLFEPNPEFFEELKVKIGDRKNVFLNNYGLSDKEEELRYNPGNQSFLSPINSELILPLKTLDWYVQDKRIDRIDFLKIDTEGWDYKVLQGGGNTIKICRYIQYEHWNDKLCFHDLLENDFIMCYMGYRNVLCIRKGEKWL